MRRQGKKSIAERKKSLERRLTETEEGGRASSLGVNSKAIIPTTK